MFDHGQSVKITPFTRKYLRLLDGTLRSFEEEEAEKFNQYIQNIENEAIEGGNEEWNVLKHNPIVFEDSPFPCFELTGGLNRIQFSVADDPFYKSLRSKYYPEVVILNMKGEVKARVNPETRSYARHGQEALIFEDDFREPQLKINDDKRVHINLSQLVPKLKLAGDKPGAASASSLGGANKDNQHLNGKMILLTVKITDALRKSPARSGEFDRAWYRLVNSDTSQTLEYNHFKNVQSPDNPASSEDAGAGEDGEDGAGKQSGAPQYTYVAGRIFFDHKGNGRWVYESFNHVFASEKFEKDGSDLGKILGDIYARSEREVEE